MSEQAKDNVQVIGAGVLGFVAVVGVAGLLLSRFGGPQGAPAAAHAPVEDAALQAPAASARPSRVHERRQSSPQPLLGALPDEALSEDAPAAPVHASLVGSSASDPSAASAAPSLGALGAPRHAGKGESLSSARAEVKTFAGRPAASAAAEAAPAAKPVPRLKLDGSRNSIASSVHYGVTSRAELMGKAAGPVYNFKGSKGGAESERVAALTEKASADISALEKEIDANPSLTAAQKAEIKAKLGQKK